MKLKRILSGALAGVMALSMTAVAFASANTDTSLTQTTNMTGELAQATVKLTVPNDGKVILNPYHIKVDIAGTTGDTEDDVSTGIISVPKVIKSETNAALKVDVAVTPTYTTAGMLSSAALASSDTTKKAFMYFEIVGCGTEDPSADLPSIAWPAAYAAANKNQLVIDTATTVEKKSTDTMLTIPNASEEAQYAAFRVTGEAVESPKKGDGSADPWADADKIDVKVVFTFTPTKDPEPAAPATP